MYYSRKNWRIEKCGEDMKLMIKEARRAARFTQTDLANAIGVNLSTVGNWERGITIPDIEQVFNCAVALGCTPNDLCGWQERDAPCGRPLTAEEARLVGSFRECTPREKSAIVNMAETMADGGMAKDGGLREGREAL